METDDDGDQKTDMRAPQPHTVVSTGPRIPPGFQLRTVHRTPVVPPVREIQGSEVVGTVVSNISMTPLFGTPSDSLGEHVVHLPAGSVVGVQLGPGSTAGGMRYVRVERPSVLRLEPRASEQIARDGSTVQPRSSSGPSEPQLAGGQGSAGAGSQDTAAALPSAATAPATSGTTVVSTSDPDQKSSTPTEV